MPAEPKKPLIVISYAHEDEPEKPAEGEVIAVGNGKPDDKGGVRALEVKNGDRVLFGKYSGNEIKIDGIEHIILREEEVLGVLEK